MPPRRFQFLFAIVLLLLSLWAFGPSSSAELYEEVADAVKNPHMPELPSVNVPFGPINNPFGPSAHKPPQAQPNSTSTSQYRAIKWFNDFKWRNPFSSAVTLDENIAVLPPLKQRPPIYTFYDVKGKQDKAVSEAESRLLLAWRRAWWAQGFKPQVLSRLESMQHPQYQMVQRMKLDPKVEFEFIKWLAWGYMGGGILTNWLALPMAEYDNPMLSFLRRKEYPVLSRVDTLQHGVFFGEDKAVNDVIKKVVGHEMFKNTTATKDKIAELAKKPNGPFVNLLTEEDIAVDAKANGIAYYSIDAIANTYSAVAKKLDNTTQVEGLNMLATLINSHLHLTFQENFPEGVAIVKPLPEHTTALMYEAIDISRNLTQCPSSPIPTSCPPNRPKCKPCDPTNMKDPILLPTYKNAPKLYEIGTVPHPYTINLLHYTMDMLTENYLRRMTDRDLWVTAATKDVLSGDHTSERRVVQFKETVAAEPAISNSLWLTAERESQVDLDWIFGFNLPQVAAPDGADSKPLEDGSDIKTFPRPPQPKPIEGVKMPEEKYIKNEEERLTKARTALKNKDRHMQTLISMVEQWNLADTEAWKFARSWSARRRVEREVWEEEEKKFAGSERKSGVRPGGGGKMPWSDRSK